MTLRLNWLRWFSVLWRGRIELTREDLLAMLKEY